MLAIDEHRAIGRNPLQLAGRPWAADPQVEVAPGEVFDRDSLERIFKTIDQLEKSEVQVKSYSRYDELFARFLFPALGLL